MKRVTGVVSIITAMVLTGCDYITDERVEYNGEYSKITNNTINNTYWEIVHDEWAGNIAEFSMTKVGHEFFRYNLRINSALQ